MIPPDSTLISWMLHAHMPYCRKSGRWPAGEEWLFEAMFETYIPLLQMFRRFQQQNLRPRIMVGVVPILAEQLADPYMQDQFGAYMEDKIARAQKDQTRWNPSDPKYKVAVYWEEKLREIYHAYSQHFFRDILGSLKWFQEEGVIELVTSAATHGFLPLMEYDSAVYAQIHLGVTTYEKYFGQKPKGFWLPECAYRWKEWDKHQNRERKALDEWLADEGIQYFFTENIGIERAKLLQSPKTGSAKKENQPWIHQAYKLESGVVAVGRNLLTSRKVWSPQEGYPGNPAYREFHQKDGESGLHYWRVTGKSQMDKAIYDPVVAKEIVLQQASDFVSLLEQTGNQLHQTHPMKFPPLINSQYDAELFGHWWWEGPAWLEATYTLLMQSNRLIPISMGDYIHEYGDRLGTIRMASSTWGENGDFTVWQNPEHGWLWPYINAVTFDFERVLQDIKASRRILTDRDTRILQQTAREKLLLEGSDWPFLLYTKQAKEYANQRFHNHHQRFNKLLWACKDLTDPSRLLDHELAYFEDKDNPWAHLSWDIFRTRYQ